MNGIRMLLVFVTLMGTFNLYAQDFIFKAAAKEQGSLDPATLMDCYHNTQCLFHNKEILDSYLETTVSDQINSVQNGLKFPNSFFIQMNNANHCLIA